MGTMIALASDHLRRSVAWATTSSLQRLACLVGVAQAEVNNFDVHVVIK